MEDLDTDEYIDIVTTYRCKFCNFTSVHPKDIGLHVKTVHIKPRTIIVANSSQITGTVPDNVVSNAVPSVAVFPNLPVASDVVANTTSTADCQDVGTIDVVSRAVKESDLEVQKEAELNENEVVGENEVADSLESLIVEETNNDPTQLNTILTYNRNEMEQNGQIVGYYSRGQIYTSLVPYQQDQGQVIGEQVDNQVYDNNVQVVDNNRNQMTLSFVDISNEKDSTEFKHTAATPQQVKERAVPVLDSEVRVGNIPVIKQMNNEENPVSVEESIDNSRVKYVIQEATNQTYDNDNTAPIRPKTDTDYINNSVTQGTDMTEMDNSNMHIIIENNNNASVQRISIDSETLKKSLVSNTQDSDTQSEEYITVLAQNQASSATVDDSNVTTKELYLCGNCSVGFNSIQECKDHMLAEHGQYAEENLTGGVPANDSPSSKVDVSTQVEPRKRPGRKKKTEVQTSPVTVKEEVISDSGSDEDWSEKLNVDYSHSTRSRRKRRPPAALKNDYYLGKFVQ